MFLLKIAMLLASVVCTFAWPEGAPADACDGMTPQHPPNVSQPLDRSPYQLSLSSGTYSQSQTITLVISSQKVDYYKGILLEARNSKDVEAKGKWLLSHDEKDHGYLTCGNPQGAVTHLDENRKTLPRKFSWIASEDYGDVQFFATVVEGYHTFYVELKSQRVKYSTSSSPALISNSVIVPLVALLYSNLI